MKMNRRFAEHLSPRDRSIVRYCRSSSRLTPRLAAIGCRVTYAPPSLTKQDTTRGTRVGHSERHAFDEPTCLSPHGAHALRNAIFISITGLSLAVRHYRGNPMANIRTFWRECFTLFMECINPLIAVACRLIRSRKNRFILSGRALC